MKQAELKKSLQEAESYCEEHGYRFTESRQHVLSIISGSERALGAYGVLEQLGQYINNPKPPTAYRAIEFWQAHGFIHRIESLNAYVACSEGHRHKGSQYMICNSCGEVEEIHLCTIPEPLQKKADAGKFKLSHWNTELHGVCKKCA